MKDYPMRLSYRGTYTGATNPDTDEYDDDTLFLRTTGCGCCSKPVLITDETLDEAIQEAREWLEYLEGLQ
jgi:hypothetical protein